MSFLICIWHCCLLFQFSLSVALGSYYLSPSLFLRLLSLLLSFSDLIDLLLFVFFRTAVHTNAIVRGITAKTGSLSFRCETRICAELHAIVAA